MPAKTAYAQIRLPLFRSDGDFADNGGLLESA